ncbi:XdhC [Herbaspirillum frisingense GSF30]|uniref:XdhC n=1 Tax=Herbaspirillum frisingense GSF30 TaxID=864073 RepID=A0AAI9IBJ6_9BURK|nr:XdhC family protein [Herbaspirillum frisingense]EOA03087.1 XdhC [Herbaspirillum frisingense GSF30]
MNDTTDLKVLRALHEWRQAGRRALLATVVSTWGSSPRPVGSQLAIRDDGRLIGSVSGGCIEDDLLFQYIKNAPTAWGRPEAPQLVRYGIDADEAHRFGLPCGGTLELLLEFDPPAAPLQELVLALESGQLVCRSVDCLTGQSRMDVSPSPADLMFDGQTLRHTMGPDYRMLLIGAGMLAEYLATMALFNGFSVTLCDPRSEYLGGWAVPGVRIVTDMPDDAVQAFRPDQRSCVIALTHDPKLDDLALMEAVASPAFYVGAIGSRRNSAARKDRMMTHFGKTEESLARLRGPIGLYIGSKTPSEIAVSVMAEVLAVKNGVAVPAAMSVAAMKQARVTAESSPSPT